MTEEVRGVVLAAEVATSKDGEKTFYKIRVQDEVTGAPVAVSTFRAEPFQRAQQAQTEKKKIRLEYFCKGVYRNLSGDCLEILEESAEETPRGKKSPAPESEYPVEKKPFRDETAPKPGDMPPVEFDTADCRDFDAFIQEEIEGVMRKALKSWQTVHNKDRGPESDGEWSSYNGTVCLYRDHWVYKDFLAHYDDKTAREVYLARMEKLHATRNKK